MGSALPKPVTAVVVKRFGGAAFRVGFAEMNGWRQSMEDAHVVFMQAAWAFFGVFDGHGGSQCSTFVAKRLNEELAGWDKPPEDDLAMKQLVLRIDSEFLDTGQTSGSTGTFCIVTSPAEAGGRYGVRIGNVGDSRILLGRRDGSMVEGGGTDGALTTDHKPNHPVERARIERNGGRVDNLGVARVNGDLAVSRAFGDSQFKETGGPGPEERPVTADPELVSLDCGPQDFLILVCDGISEGEFPNREVVRYAAEVLGQGDQVDPGAAAAAVCQRALDAGSRDNLSCMIVLMGGGEVQGAATELIPGPLDEVGNEGFRTAYAAMADHAGVSLAEAAEMRYGIVKERLSCEKKPAEDEDPELTGLTRELATFGDGPPADLAAEARRAWFEAWLEHMQEQGPSADNGPSMREGLLRMALCQKMGLQPGSLTRPPPPVEEPPGPPDALGGGTGSSCDMPRAAGGGGGVVRVVGLSKLKMGVEAHPGMEWQDAYTTLAGKEGIAIEEDFMARTTQVKFGNGIREWLPTPCLISLTRCEEDP